MPLLTKSVALGLGLAFVPAANCLQVDSGNKYTRQGSEMMAWDGDDGEEESQSRVAVLVTGSVESLALTPLLGNVVQANARKGLQVDLYFALRGRSSPGETTNPKMVNLRKSFDEVSYGGKLMDYICELAKKEGATKCSWMAPSDEAAPVGAAQRSIMVQQPAGSASGQEAVRRWRSQAHLWAAVRLEEEAGSELADQYDQYDAVMVTRSDTYFLAPFLVDAEGFQLESQRVSTTPCLDVTGISDKAVVMGREAAEVLLGVHEAWKRGEERLSGTRTAEEVWFRTAAQAGLSVVPEPMYAAQVIWTGGGLPCFSEATFRLGSESAGLEQCFAESVGDAPVSSLFKAFSCETGNPAYYELLWHQQVRTLHKMVADIANRNESDSILVMAVDQGETDMAVDTLTSLSDGVDAATNTVVVGTSSGVCKALADKSGVSGHKCLVVVPQQDVQLSVLKHAILTTVASAGLGQRVVSVTPGVLFTKGLTTALAASSRTIAFASKSTKAQTAQACREEAGDVADIDSGFLALTDAPEVTDMLLRAWQLMEEDKALSQQAALAAALGVSGHSEFGLLSCGLLSPPVAPTERVVGAAQPQGVQQQIKREVQQRASGSAWVDRLRGEAPKQRRSQEASAVAAEGERKAEWTKKALEWKDMWAERVHKLEEQNGYNATAVREERIRQRAYNKAHRTHKKHVRYLPPDEAAKVKAREDKWEADVAKQKADDAEKAEARKEAFRRQVEEAQKIIENRRKEKQQRAAEADEAADDELSAA
mmetsp:Transcript_126612/g.343711  ORF Transcript_126612/g.343711 Transcript_126612/m.343711 type:complete len:766 (-) Transcript_126612:107-2404(-)